MPTYISCFDVNDIILTDYDFIRNDRLASVEYNGHLYSNIEQHSVVIDRGPTMTILKNTKKKSRKIKYYKDTLENVRNRRLFENRSEGVRNNIAVQTAHEKSLISSKYNIVMRPSRTITLYNNFMYHTHNNIITMYKKI